MEMRQINNGFCDHYYLTEQGTIYNSQTNTYREETKDHKYKLKTLDGRYKRITVKDLYMLVYNKRYCKDRITNLEDEHWKEIDDTNGLYLISDKGRVKSLANYEAKILKPNILNGYERVDIMYNKQRYSKLVSRLVAAAFIDNPKHIDMQLHHKDGNRLNNRADNLVWLTQIEHAAIHKAMKSKGDEAQNNE
jgi:hypothetical protein